MNEIIDETKLETSLPNETIPTEEDSSVDTELEELESELDEDESGEINTEEDITSSIQYILVTAETQSQVDYSPNLTSIEDKLDTIVSCSIVIMAVIVLSWIHLISRKRRNRK